MKLKTIALMGGGKSEYDISLQFTEPKYGKVTVTHPSKSKPNQVINISTNIVEEDRSTYSVGAITAVTTKGLSIAVNTVSANNWSFVMPSSDVIITATEIKYTAPCLSVDTMITLAGDHKVPFGYLKSDDIVKVWDFDNGCYSDARLLWLTPILQADDYRTIIFEDGTHLDIIGRHRAFCIETNRFDRMPDLLGKHVYTINGIKKIVDIKHIKEKIHYRNAVSYYHMNIIANDVLTSTGFNNLYPINNMRFVKPIDRTRNRLLNKLPTIDQRFYHGLRLSENTTSIHDIISCIEEKWRGSQWLV